MISKQMRDWGANGNSIREIAAYGERRAAEIGADAILLAKNIDGVYTADPRVDKTATKIDAITYQEILSRGLAAMDSTATSFCMDNHIPILVFGLDNPENIYRAVTGEEIGTIVK